MKIALAILHADPMRGGAERYTHDLAGALARRGHQVSLLATSFAQVPAGVRGVPLAARSLTRTGRYARMIESLDQQIDIGHYDIVHAMLPVLRCDVYHPHAGLAIAAARQAPLAALINPRRLRMAVVEQRLLKACPPPVVLCLSNYVKAAIKRHYPLDDAHLPILFNAVDLQRFEPGRKPRTTRRGQSVALMIAQDFSRKGLRQAILALSRVPQKRLVLHVVGKQRTGPYEKLARRAGVGDRVRFLGPTDDPLPLYRDADFFVLPTKHDPCSLVVLEALAMGLPVISTRFNGACEIMSDGVHGFVLPDPTDVPALAEAMRQMLDADLRARMSAACLELRPQLSYEHHLDQLIQIYQNRGLQSGR